MDALNHADQMRLANLIDNSDDAEIQKKIDQVVELTRSTRDQASVALHDCHYDVEKAVDMILEGDHAIVENQWRSAGKKKNKNLSSQVAKTGSQPSSHHHQHHSSNTSGGKGGSSAHRNHSSSSAVGSSNAPGSSLGSVHNSKVGNNDVHLTQQHQQPQSQPQQQQHHQNHLQLQQQQQQTHQQTQQTQQQHHQQSHRSAVTANSASLNQFNNNSTKQDASDSLKSLVGISSSNLISTSDHISTSTTAPTKTPSLQHQQQRQPQHLQRNAMQLGSRQYHQRSTRIPDSAVEMPNNELQASSLNVQFGELEIRDGAVGTTDAKGTFQDVLESNRLGRQSGLPNSHSTFPSHDNKSNRQISQQNLGKGGPRRSYNSSNNNNNDDRRFYNSNSNRGGRQLSGSQRSYNQRPGQMNNNSRGVRTILNRGLQPNSALSSSNSNQASSGFPNSIDTWTNSTAEAAAKPSNNDQVGIGVGNTLRVGQWSDVATNEDWSEEDWEAKVMETKVFTPSSKAVDGPLTSQKNQPLLTETSVPAQINLATKLSEAVRDDVSSQQSTLNTVTQSQSQQPAQKPMSHINDIFDASVAKVVLEQQNLAIKPKTSIGISQYTKDNSDSKAVLDQQNLSSIKPKTTMSMNQYNKEASESLKSLVGITSAKGSVPSVPPGALPLMSQPQYIMGNAYQPAIFPYAYQTPDVHYQVAAQTAGREQNFQSVYSPSDATKFNRGTDGDAPSITTTQAAPVASQTHNQAFVANALHAGYQLTYAMPGAFNMMPQNLYGAAPIFPHIPQPTNTGSANQVYQKNTAASYQHHTGYSAYDQLNPLIQDYVKQQQNYSSSSMQQQPPTSKSSGVSNELDVTTGGNSYNMYASVNKGQPQGTKQANYNDPKGYQQQMSGNGPQQQFGFSHNAQQPSSIAGYPLLQTHNLDGSNLGAQGSAQQQLQQQSNAQRGGVQVNPSKYYQSWN